MLRFLTSLVGAHRLVVVLRVIAAVGLAAAVGIVAMLFSNWPASVDSSLAAVTAAGWSAYIDNRDRR